MTPCFVFLHVGENIDEPTMLVQSIRTFHPQADIIQCTDLASKEVPEVTRNFRMEGNVSNLMTFRLQCFAALALKRTAIYMDTDMLLVKPCDPEKILSDADAALCERSFGRDDLINPNLRNLDFSEHKGKTFGQIYPFLACFTVTRDSSFWKAAHEELLNLPEKFHIWYGDQEALRNLATARDQNKLRIKKIPESVYACLPEQIGPPPRVLHFKGLRRKPAMRDVFHKLQGKAQ